MDMFPQMPQSFLLEFVTKCNTEEITSPLDLIEIEEAIKQYSPIVSHVKENKFFPTLGKILYLLAIIGSTSTSLTFIP